LNTAATNIGLQISFPYANFISSGYILSNQITGSYSSSAIYFWSHTYEASMRPLYS
jgi:hypothetical protein